MIHFELDGYTACDDCKDFVDDGGFTAHKKYLCHECLDKPKSNFVYICRECEGVFEEEVICCELCSGEEIEVVTKGDIGLE